MTVNPYGKTSRRGVLLNNRTIEMLEVAEMHWLRSFAPLTLTQGSYSTGTEQSAGTHDGGGVFDVRAVDLTGSQRDSVVWALRKQGFAAWLRNPSQGDWPYHIHAVAIGDKEMSAAAAKQVVAYKNGKNGLKDNGPDDGPKVTWTEYRQDVDLSYYGPEKWDDDDYKAFFNRAGWGYDVRNLNTDPISLINAKSSLENTHEHATDAEAASLAAVKVSTDALNAVNNQTARLDDIETKVNALLVAVGKLSPPA